MRRRRHQRRPARDGVFAISGAVPPFCAVIGAGPAGLAAALRLSERGARVTVFDHKASPARKFLMAGRGGLNLTHSEKLADFLPRYGAAASALSAHIEGFSPQRLRAFCAELGEETFVGSSGRVFPKSFKATPLLRAWIARLTATGVRLAMRHSFLGFDDERRLLMRDPQGTVLTLEADAVILACGGGSWPRLGSDCAWVAPLREAGVSVEPLAPANCAALIGWSQHFRDAFEGKPLKTAALRFDGATARGDLVVTREGLEGGPAYALASALRLALTDGRPATLHVDLRPDSSVEALAARLSAVSPKASASTRLQKCGLAPIAVGLLREALAGEPWPQPEALAALIKAAPLRVRGVAGLDRAISSAGGVRFEGLDDSLMIRRLPGVFVAGEMLDFDAPTGGYLLQAAFATGVAAGEGAARFLSLDALALSDARAGLGDA